MSASYVDFLSDELSEHKWLVEIEYYDTVGQTTGTLYYSTTAFGTGAGDTPASQLYEPRLLNGYNFSAGSDAIGQLGGLLPARDGGSIILAQNLGDLDGLLLYSFDGRSVTIRHGGYSPRYGDVAYSDYSVVFTGEVEGQALATIDTVTLKLRNKDTRLEFPIQDRFYSGGRYWLYFDGTNDYVDCGHNGDMVDDATVGINFSTSDFTYEFTLFIESVPGSNTYLFSRGSVGFDGITIRLMTGSGELSFDTRQAGTVQSTTSTAFPLNKRVSVAIVRDGANATWYFDGAPSNNSAGSHSDPAAAARNLYIGRNDVGTVGLYLNGFIDEVRIWASARTESQINTYMKRQLETFEVAAPLRFYSKVDDGLGNLTEEVAATTHTVSGATWLSSLQGGEELQGTPLPDAWGQRVGFAPVLCDEERLIYQVHSGSIYLLDKVFVGGAKHDLDTDKTSMYDFLSTIPTAGEYNTLVTEYGSWFRLGSAPSKPVICTVRGDNTGGTGYGDAATYRSTVGQIVRYIICNRGPQPLVDPTDLDDTSFDDLDTANSSIVGDACYDERTIADVVSYLLGSIGAVGGFKRETGLFSVKIFNGVGSLTPVLDITEKDCEEDTLEAIDVGPPIWGVDFNYRKNDVVHSTTDIANKIIVADPTTIDLSWRFLMTEWRTLRPRNSTIRTNYKGATILQLDAAITLVADSVLEAQRLLSLYSTQGQCLRVFCNQNAVQLDRMDAVTFHFQDTDAYGELQSRLQTSDTAVFVVIAVEDDAENGGTWLTLYREAIT